MDSVGGRRWPRAGSRREIDVNNRYAAEIDLSNVHNTHSMLVLMVGEGKRVLELGASSGYMTRVLQQRGCRVTAIEYDPEAGAELALVADDTIIGDLNDLSLLGGVSGRYDVVLAGDVFEHLIRPLDVLRAAVELLEPDGAVVLSVPNVAHADLRLSLLQGRTRRPASWTRPICAGSPIGPWSTC